MRDYNLANIKQQIIAVSAPTAIGAKGIISACSVNFLAVIYRSGFSICVFSSSLFHVIFSFCVILHSYNSIGFQKLRSALGYHFYCVVVNYFPYHVHFFGQNGEFTVFAGYAKWNCDINSFFVTPPCEMYLHITFSKF